MSFESVAQWNTALQCIQVPRFAIISIKVSKMNPGLKIQQEQKENHLLASNKNKKNTINDNIKYNQGDIQQQLHWLLSDTACHPGYIILCRRLIRRLIYDIK